jgi:O-Antigen ligase
VLQHILNRESSAVVARTFTPSPYQTVARTPALRRDQGKSLVHHAALLMVAVTVASGAVVFTEPALVDILTLGLIIGLPVVGLAVFSPGLMAFIAVLLVISGCHFLASPLANEVGQSISYSAVTLYLCLSAAVFAAFVARRPKVHTDLIMKAFVVAAVIATAAGIAGYFQLIPGTGELFTKYGRASGPFKDPNVFGPFLVAPMIYTLHVALNRHGLKQVTALGLCSVLAFGLLLSFSRGAWATAVIATLSYLTLSFLTSKTHRHQFRIITLIILGGVAVAGAILAASHSDSIGRLLAERAQLTQTYDVGEEGRFGGQLRAIDVIVSNPFGIGSLEFVPTYHSEEPHNVYLSMFLNSGWLGGVLFLVLIGHTIVLGFRHALRRTDSQSLFIVVFSALMATALLGLLIDSDHWRHFYLLLGVVWGLMLTDTQIARGPRILADFRNPLMDLAQASRWQPARGTASRPGRFKGMAVAQPVLVDVTGYSQYATRKPRIRRRIH